MKKELFNIICKVANVSIGVHLEATKPMTLKESKRWYENHAHYDTYYDKDGNFIISSNPVEWEKRKKELEELVELK